MSHVAVLGDGSVVTWGDADLGGDCSAVQEQLKKSSIAREVAAAAAKRAVEKFVLAAAQQQKNV